MPTIDEMAQKMQRNISPPFYDATFWKTRLDSSQKRLTYVRERATAASATKEFWEQQIPKLQRRIDYLKKRASNAKLQGGLSPSDIVARWKSSMEARWK